MIYFYRLDNKIIHVDSCEDTIQSEQIILINWIAYIVRTVGCKRDNKGAPSRNIHIRLCAPGDLDGMFPNDQ